MPIRTPRSPWPRPRRTSVGSRRPLPGRNTAKRRVVCQRCWRSCTRSWRPVIRVALTTSLTCAPHCPAPRASPRSMRVCRSCAWRRCIGDPLDMLLDRHRHIRQHRRALRAGDREQVRERRQPRAEIGVRAVRPLLASVRPPRPSCQASSAGRSCASKPVAKTIMSSGYSLPPARMPCSADLLNRAVGLGIHQRHVILVEGFEVVGVQTAAAWCRRGMPWGSASRQRRGR